MLYELMIKVYDDGRGIMRLRLLLLFLFIASGTTGISESIPAKCRMNVCFWISDVKATLVDRGFDGGKLMSVDFMDGTTFHEDEKQADGSSYPDYPKDIPANEVFAREAYEKDLRQAWVYCSKTRPLVADKFRDDWKTYNTFGFPDFNGLEEYGIVLYLYVCHELLPQNWDEALFSGLGYTNVQYQKFKDLDELLGQTSN